MRWWIVAFLTTTVYAGGEERPLPVQRSTTLNEEGAVYFVAGRQVIPRGVRLTVSRGVQIVGRQKDRAVLVVEGSLRVQGTRNQRVDFAGVAIEPGRRFQQIRLLGASLRKRAALLNDAKQPVEGEIVIEDSHFHGGAVFEIALGGGSVRIIECTFDTPVDIAGDGSLVVDVLGCSRATPKSGKRSYAWGFRKGLSITGAKQVLVRNSCLAGTSSVFRDCAVLTIDGNRILSTRLVLEQKSFAKTKIQKCDLYCSELVLKAAPRARKQRVLIDKCHFGKLVRKRDIEDAVIKDGKDNASCGAVAMLKQIKKQPLKIAE